MGAWLRDETLAAAIILLPSAHDGAGAGLGVVDPRHFTMAEQRFALHIGEWPVSRDGMRPWCRTAPSPRRSLRRDRKSTRLNSSHGYISYAVFCLKKKNKKKK